MAREVPSESSGAGMFVGVALRRQDSRVRALRLGGRGIERFPYTSLSAVSPYGISRVPSLDRGGW